jgi:hypothetical protein
MIFGDYIYCQTQAGPVQRILTFWKKFKVRLNGKGEDVSMRIVGIFLRSGAWGWLNWGLTLFFQLSNYFTCC